MESKLNILFVEDIISDAELIWHELKKDGITFSKKIVDNSEDYLKALEEQEYDIIISDYSLPNFDGMSALLIRNEKAPLIPFIIATGSINEEVAVECMKAGADDYIIKDNLARIGQAVVNSINKARLHKEKIDAETAQRESESKYRNIFENIQDLYYETSTDGTIIEVSPSIEIISKGQFKRHDLIGRSMYEFYTDPDERQALLDILLKGGTASDFEITLKNRDGSLIQCSLSAKIIFDSNGKPQKIIGSMRDISSRKNFEEQLIKAKEKAEESDKLKTAFLHNISHEIRTPMNAIVGFSNLLSDPFIDSKTRETYIDVIIQSSSHLLTIITDIVDISNIEANLIKIVRTEINVNSVIDNLFTQFKPKASEKKIDLKYEKGLSNIEAYILVDGTRLNQILINLLNNALKFTDQGEINISYKLKGKMLEFCVSDTGIGIPEDYHSKIFDRFYQVQKTETKLYEGTGLGLAISKAYVELMGGKIWLISESGKRTSFFFTIPYDKQNVESEAVLEKSTPKDFVFSEKKRILVAEDIDSNFKLIRYFLTASNVEVIRAVNGKEAVEICMTDNNIDLVLMDLKMPVMDGYTAVRMIREKGLVMPIIAQTAYVDDKFNAIASGCSGFITKPFDKKSLINALREFI